MAGPVIDPFHRELRKRLEKDLEDTKNSLCSNLADGIEQYRFMCGAIAKLQQVLDECEEVEKQIYVQQQDEE